MVTIEVTFQSWITYKNSVALFFRTRKLKIWLILMKPVVTHLSSCSIRVNTTWTSNHLQESKNIWKLKPFGNGSGSPTIHYKSGAPDYSISGLAEANPMKGKQTNTFGYIYIDRWQILSVNTVSRLQFGIIHNTHNQHIHAKIGLV